MYVIMRPHYSTSLMRPALLQMEQHGVSMCQSVCLFVTTMSPARMVELIKMPFEMLSQVGPRNHVLDGSQHLPCEEAFLWMILGFFCMLLSNNQSGCWCHNFPTQITAAFRLASHWYSQVSH